MKQALVLALVSFGWVTALAAQSPNTSPSPGPHDPNPAMNAPDLRLPPPCAPTANLAATDGVMNPTGVTAAPVPDNRVMRIESGGGLQCSANTRAQSAELPGLAPGIQ
ncbi:MAG TPA: hypothetical protein VGF92_18730 [Stellaceae bacterium]|jgi:hypothetical protein